LIGEKEKTQYLAIIENSTNCPKCHKSHWDVLDELLKSGAMHSDDDRWQTTCSCGTVVDLIWDDDDNQWNVGVKKFKNDNQIGIFDSPEVEHELSL